MRTCRKCHLPKPADVAHFVVSRECRGGITYECRECRHKAMVKWRATPIQKARRADYHRRTYQLSDRVDKCRARAAAKPFHDRAQVMRAGLRDAAARGVSVDLTTFTVKRISDMLREQPRCPCCNVTLDIGRKLDGMKRDASPSLDRFVPSWGYIVGNVTIICWRCNNLKRDATVEELQALVDWMRRRSPLAEGLRTIGAGT